MFKKIIKHLKDCFKKGVDIYMNGQEIKAKTLVESLEIGADLLKSAGKGLCAAGHTIARGIHTTIHEIIKGMSNLAKKTTETKENCLMSAAISAGVGIAVGLAYFVRARSFDKNNAVIMAKYSVVE